MPIYLRITVKGEQAEMYILILDCKERLQTWNSSIKCLQIFYYFVNPYAQGLIFIGPQLNLRGCGGFSNQTCLLELHKMM
jgi:hypothetical protein